MALAESSHRTRTPMIAVECVWWKIGLLWFVRTDASDQFWCPKRKRGDRTSASNLVDTLGALETVRLSLQTTNLHRAVVECISMAREREEHDRSSLYSIDVLKCSRKSVVESETFQIGIISVQRSVVVQQCPAKLREVQGWSGRNKAVRVFCLSVSRFTSHAK